MNTNTKTYRVTVTEYAASSQRTETHVIDAANGDEAFDEAVRRLNPAPGRGVGGSFHRIVTTTNPTNDWGLR